MDFEWDHRKREANLKKYKIDFKEACFVFGKSEKNGYIRRKQGKK